MCSESEIETALGPFEIEEAFPNVFFRVENVHIACSFVFVCDSSVNVEEGSLVPDLGLGSARRGLAGSLFDGPDVGGGVEKVDIILAFLSGAKGTVKSGVGLGGVDFECYAIAFRRRGSFFYELRMLLPSWIRSLMLN